MKIIEKSAKEVPLSNLKYGDEFLNSDGRLCVKVNNMLGLKNLDDTQSLVFLDNGELHTTTHYYLVRPCIIEIHILEKS